MFKSEDGLILLVRLMDFEYISMMVDVVKVMVVLCFLSKIGIFVLVEKKVMFY